MKTFGFVGVLLIALLPLLPSTSHAYWKPNGVALSTAANNQEYPVIVSDDAGGAIVAWIDNRGGTDHDIYAQRIDAAGRVSWSADGVLICAAVDDQRGLQIASDGAGGAIVTWEDYRSIVPWVYAQRVNASGAVQWAADGVPLSPVAWSSQYNARIVSDGDGGAIVTWEDQRSDPDDIYAQRISSSGERQWGASGFPVCSANWIQESPAIASDGNGGAIVTWEDFRIGNVRTYAQRVDASGTPRWTFNGVRLCNDRNGQLRPAIAEDGAGGAFVVWEDYRGTPLDIYAQRINAAGAIQWGMYAKAVCDIENMQEFPTIMADGAGGAIVVWDDHRNGNNFDIYAQRINSSGAVQWRANGMAVCTAEGDQGTPGGVSDGVGGVILPWTDWRSGTTPHIYAQRVGSLGTPLWSEDGVTLCTATNGEGSAQIVSDGAGGAIVTWADSRSGTADIYAQQIGPDGLVPDTTPPTISVSLNRDSLWPPNNKLVEVCATVTVTDDLDPAPTFTLLTITAVDGKRAVDAADDIKDAALGTADLCYDLRASRSGNGDGRVYRIIYQANDASGNVAYDTVNVRVPLNTALHAEMAAPRVTLLSSVHPNPFNPETTVDYSLETTQRVVISIFDVRGSLVRRLVDQSMSAGEHRATWNGVDDAGRPASSGIYFVRMTAGSYVETRKIVMLK